MNGELPDIQTGFRKGRGTRDQIANIHWPLKKTNKQKKNKTKKKNKRVPEKHLLLLYGLCQSL